MNKKQGFTLLELIIVVAILAILFSTVILVLNPAREIAKAYDSQRLSDLNALNKAIQQYYIDFKNYNSLNITGEEKEICDTRYTTGTDNKLSCGDFADMSALVPVYIAGMPTDPINLLTKPENKGDSPSGNGYTVRIEAGNKIILEAKNLTSNNTAIDTVKNINIVDVRYQIVLLALIVTICVTLAIYFILNRNRE